VDSHYAGIVEFVKPAKRDCYREMLTVPRLRHKFVGLLAHFADFDAKYRVPISSDKLGADKIAFELEKRHSPRIVYAVSENSSLHQKQRLLAEALQEIVGLGMGTVLSCIPGGLLFVETESERFILHRQVPIEKRAYVRFVIGRKDEDSQVEQGIFHAAGDALDHEIVTGCDADELYELRSWFNENLETPSAFGRGSLPLGVCWFKTGATEHISRIWAMVSILERNGVYVQKIKTDKPGYVVYEDEWQIVAEPFRKGILPGT